MLAVVWIIVKTFLWAILIGAIGFGISVAFERFRDYLWIPIETNKLEKHSLISLIVVVIAIFLKNLTYTLVIEKGQIAESSEIAQGIYLASSVLIYVGILYFLIVEIITFIFVWNEKKKLLNSLAKGIRFAQDDVKDADTKKQLNFLYNDMKDYNGYVEPSALILYEDCEVPLLEDIYDRVDDPYASEQVAKYILDVYDNLIFAPNNTELEILLEKINRKQRS